jgi:hypothetical protein
LKPLIRPSPVNAVANTLLSAWCDLESASRASDRVSGCPGLKLLDCFAARGFQPHPTYVVNVSSDGTNGPALALRRLRAPGFLAQILN